MTGHCINRQDGTSQVEHLEQCRDRGNFIALIIGFKLAQYELIGAGVGTHHVDGALPVVSVIGAAQGFTINGYHFATGQFVYGFNLSQKAFTKFRLIDVRNQKGKSIINRQAIFKQAQLKEPFMVTKNVFANVSPALTFDDHSADRDKQNIKQWVIDFCALLVVTDDGEMRFDGIYVHDDSSKEEHNITVGWLGQLWSVIGLKMFMILP